jgi:chromosomal replication initiator protein
VETRHASLLTPDLRDEPCTEGQQCEQGDEQLTLAPRHANACAFDQVPPTLSQRLVQIIGQASFDRYFDGRVELRPADGRLEVHVSSKAAADVLRRRFGVALRQAGADDAAGGTSPEVVFVSATETADPAASDSAASSVDAPAASPAVASPHAARANHHRHAPTRYRLEDFVVGESNRMAYNAAAHLVDDDAPGSRILFVHGTCGLGKTHLLQGVAHRFRERLPGATVRMTSGESFMNDFVAAIRDVGAHARGASGGNSGSSANSGGVAKFRKAYRRADLLCIDDVHFLAAKQATQDELLHTFDEIERGGARVLLVSDQHPRSLKKFSPALVSRFMSGMVASITPPEAALRERIVRVFAIRRGLALDDGAVRAVASRAAWLPGATTGPSIRDIEGMLTKIDALRRIAPEYLGADGRIGAAAVDRAFGAGDGSQTGMNGTVVQAPRPAKPVRMHVIVAQTCSALGVEAGDLAGKTRHKRVVLARALITYIARGLTTQSFPDIARALGRPSHSTVITAYQRFCLQLQADEPVMIDHASEPTTLSVLTRQLTEAVVHASARG